jgi:hypothetical protein
MRDLVILFVQAIATLARLLGPGGIRSVVAESCSSSNNSGFSIGPGSGLPIYAPQIAWLPGCVLS